MRSVSPRLRRGGALLLLLAALAVPPVYAEEGFPNDPPEARARPPIGVASASQEPGFFERFVEWLVLMARALPPLP